MKCPDCNAKIPEGGAARSPISADGKLFVLVHADRQICRVALKRSREAARRRKVRDRIIRIIARRVWSKLAPGERRAIASYWNECEPVAP